MFENRNNRPSICFISPFMGPLLVKNPPVGTGGAEKQFYMFGKELAKQGWEVIFIAQMIKGEIISDFYKVVWVDFSYLGGSKFMLIRSILQLDKALRKTKSDYYVIKNAHSIFPSIFLHKFLRGATIIFWGQTSTDFDVRKQGEMFIMRGIRHFSIRNADIIITQTLDQSKSLMKYFSRQGNLVPNVIDLEPTNTEIIKGKRVFWCGNSLKNKRADIFLELAKINPDLDFIMAVNKSTYQNDSKLQSEANRIENLTYLGCISSDLVGYYMSNASVLVNTSEREGFPNTFLQSWVKGVPVLSLTVNPDHIITNYKLGICVFENQDYLLLDPKCIAEVLTPQLLFLVNKSQEYYYSCRNYVLENHAPEKACNHLIAALLGGTSGESY